MGIRETFVKDAIVFAMETPAGKAAATAAEHSIEEVMKLAGVTPNVGTKVFRAPLADRATVRDLVRSLIPDMKAIKELKLAGADTFHRTLGMGHTLTTHLNRLGVPGRTSVGEARAEDKLGEFIIPPVSHEIGAVMRVNTEVLKDPAYPISEFGSTLAHEATHREQISSMRAALSTQPTVTGITRERAFDLQHSFHLPNPLPAARLELKQFAHEVNDLMKAPSLTPRKLLDFEANGDDNKLKALFGRDRFLPYSIKNWAQAQLNRSIINLSGFRDFVLERQATLIATERRAFKTYQDFYHEQEARVVGQIAKEETAKILGHL